MVNGKANRLVQRTRQRLLDSLLALMVERGYENITVQDILDRAEAGRATFYQHFRGKEDLLRSGIEQLREMLLAERKSGPGTGPNEPLGFTLILFQHIGGHRDLYRAIAGRESGVIVERKFRRVLAELVREDLITRRLGRHNPVQVDFAVHYVVGALWKVMTWWLDQNVALIAEEVNDLFRRFTLPGLQAALATGGAMTPGVATT